MEYLELARGQLDHPLLQLPTLAWIDASDTALSLQCLAGVVASVALIAGVAPLVMLLLLWVLYLSLSVAGQTFFAFQWDLLLLEAGERFLYNRKGLLL